MIFQIHRQPCAVHCTLYWRIKLGTQIHGYIKKQNNIIGYTKRKIIDIKVPKLDTKLTTAHVPIRDT